MDRPADRLVDFEHPAKAYRLRHPAHWEVLVQEQGQSCGFGPRDRDDVGLWITILPFRVETERLQDNLRRIFEQAVGAAQVTNIREDPSLLHFGLKAENADPAQGGHFWLVAGGDLVLLASSQLPRAEQHLWDGPFDHLMASLQVVRDDDLRELLVAHAILERLRAHFPDRDYLYDGRWIRGGDHVISPANLARRVRSAPRRQVELIEEFLAGLMAAGDDAPGAGGLDAVRDLIVPVLKNRAYVRPDQPTAHLVSLPWLADVVICYAIRGARTFRFLLESDVDRWEIDGDRLHQLALGNLGRLPWPEGLPAASAPAERVIVVSSGDGLDAARLLDPRLHGLFAPALGSPFLAGVPDRGTLVLFPRGEARLLGRLAASVREDFERAAYPISTALFLVHSDGVALAEDR